MGRSSSSLHHHPAGSIEINVAVEQKAATVNAVNKSNSNLILQSLLQHVLFLPGEVEQHRHSPDQLKGLTEEDKQVRIRCGPEPPTHALSEEGALGTDLCLSGGHKLKDNMFEVLKVDLS